MTSQAFSIEKAYISNDNEQKLKFLVPFLDEVEMPWNQVGCLHPGYMKLPEDATHQDKYNMASFAGVMQILGLGITGDPDGLRKYT